MRLLFYRNLYCIRTNKKNKNKFTFSLKAADLVFCVSIHSKYFATSVYAPGADEELSQAIPNEAIPVSPPLHTRGPPESP